MRVIISGGGTGGHIYPALAIAETILKHHPEADILFVGTKNGLEATVIPEKGYRMNHITVGYLMRKLSFHNIRSGVQLLKGLRQSKKILQQFEPDIVIGTGGYVSGPILYAAAAKKIPTLIHEQNVYPGLTTKILSRKVDAVCTSFSDSHRYFQRKDHLYVTGNPIREEFKEIYRRRKIVQRIKNPVPSVLVFGGSGGAKALNNALIELSLLQSSLPYKLIWVTGKTHFEEINSKMNHPGIELRSYINDMPKEMERADLIIASAGAITIAEILAVGVPCILIPKARTAENHQEYNARSIESYGGAKVVLESDLSGSILHKTIEDLLGSHETMEKMTRLNLEHGIISAADEIYNRIQQVIFEKK